jgi:hypothetical protein
MIAVSLLLISLVSSVGKFRKKKVFHYSKTIYSFLAGNCLLGGGCGYGQCCSSFGYCGVGSTYCGGVGIGYPAAVYPTINCRVTGCAAGYCCSSYG